MSSSSPPSEPETRRNRRSRLIVIVVSGVAIAALWGSTASNQGVFTSPRGLDGSIHLGVGSAPPPAAGRAAPPPADPGTPVRDVVGVPPPYYGPTPAELAALARLRRAVHSSWQRTAAQLTEAVGRDAPIPPEPQVNLPPRRLTPYELQQLYRSADDLERQ